MSESKKKISNFVRNDGYESGYSPVGSSICEVWIHKQVAVSTGPTEDDFIIEEKPKKIDEYDIDKQIQEASKNADLKTLVSQVLSTGDESLLSQRVGYSADVTGMPKDLFETMDIINNGSKARENIPSGLYGDKSPVNANANDNAILNMSKEDIVKYYENLLSSNKTGGSNPPESE